MFPLTELLNKKVKWSWLDRQVEAFKTIKAKFTKVSVLACLDVSKTFVLPGLWAAYIQNLDGKDYVMVS